MFRYTLFTFFKLPSVFWAGIRVTKIDLESCVVSVKHRWINQNPFKSMFWAVQGMAAEFTTGTLIRKATGRITFSCTQGAEVTKLMNELIETGTPKTIWMESIGINEAGDIVSRFNFEWTLNIKK